MVLDVEKMECVYFNLLFNVFKFILENGIIIVIFFILIKEENRRYVCLVVVDIGLGIFVWYIWYIFDCFYQMDVNYVGLGIGFVLVKVFVELYGGVIMVDSVEGKGIVFMVDIFMEIVEGQFVDWIQELYIIQLMVVEELEEMEIEERFLDENKECILIIDDNVDVCGYVKLLLKEEYMVIEVVDGYVGLKKVMKYVFDVIICDVMMLVMDGLECCRKLKMELQIFYILVMLFIVCFLDEQWIQGFECGVDFYIFKFFNFKLLLVCFWNLIDNYKWLKQFFGDKIILFKEFVSEVDKGFVECFRELIEVNLIDFELSVEELGSKMGLSRVQFYCKIKVFINYFFNELVCIVRLKKVVFLLVFFEKIIFEIMYEVGFIFFFYFIKCYKEYFGESFMDFLKCRG